MNLILIVLRLTAAIPRAPEHAHIESTCEVLCAMYLYAVPQHICLILRTITESSSC